MSTSVQTFFEHYAHALMSYEPGNITSFYQAPMAVYSDQGVRTVQEMSEVEAFWQAGVQPYKARGIEKTVPWVLTEEQLSHNVFLGKVLWINSDESGREITRETNIYILSETDNGLKISGLIFMNP